MLIVALLLAAIGQSVPGATHPASPGEAPPAPPTMVAAPIALAIAGWDVDGDGRTSRAELAAGVARSFAAIDTAHRGMLSYLGFADWAGRFLGDRTALPSPFEADTDGNDQVSLAELQAACAAAFDRLDVDHDGYVSRAELLSVRAGATAGPGGERGGRGRPRR